jgi:hypothetical protein
MSPSPAQTSAVYGGVPTDGAKTAKENHGAEQDQKRRQERKQKRGKQAGGKQFDGGAAKRNKRHAAGGGIMRFVERIQKHEGHHNKAQYTYYHYISSPSVLEHTFRTTVLKLLYTHIFVLQVFFKKIERKF